MGQFLASADEEGGGFCLKSAALPLKWKKWQIPAGKVRSLPLYPYRCTQCGHRFEKIQSFADEQEKICPKCGGALERTLTAPGLSFKGAGWYVNDYAGKKQRARGRGCAGRSEIGDEIQNRIARRRKLHHGECRFIKFGLIHSRRQARRQERLTAGRIAFTRIER